MKFERVELRLNDQPEWQITLKTMNEWNEME